MAASYSQNTLFVLYGGIDDDGTVCPIGTKTG